jgi:hypothetical protein
MNQPVSPENGDCVRWTLPLNRLIHNSIGCLQRWLLSKRPCLLMPVGLHRVAGKEDWRAVLIPTGIYSFTQSFKRLTNHHVGPSTSPSSCSCPGLAALASSPWPIPASLGSWVDR